MTAAVLSPAIDPGDAERAGAVDRGELPDLADALELADVEGVEEELLARHVRADVDRLRPLDGADLAQDPLGQRPALDWRPGSRPRRGAPGAGRGRPGAGRWRPRRG